MGSGFSFVARQKRIQLDGEDFYIDLLFYNRKLKRLIVVELKQGNFELRFIRTTSSPLAAATPAAAN
jgi:predicted nuclease of restriction endonuclease-like (RecB) superfamily